MKMATVCSGIGAPEVASAGLGFRHVFMSEIEPFPSAVLAHRWPDVPNIGDMTKINGAAWNGKVGLLVGGTPCQAFSVAGLRNSLDDERGNLTLKFVELCNDIRPGFILWENVPGVLSTKDNAFGCFLAGIVGEGVPLVPAGKRWTNAGYVSGPERNAAWRVLDAQYFGLAQRRRRVFVVACPRNGADPCQVLFEREGVQRHSAPSREKGEGFAGVAGTLSANRGGLDMPAGNANELDFCVPVAFAQNQLGEVRTGEVANTLNTNFNASGRNTPCVAAIGWSEELTASKELAGTLQYGGQGGRHDGVMTPAMQVRRLTPVECEFLQGFPRNHTLIPWRNKPADACPDGPRYKALGNSMAVPVIRWILKRILKENENAKR